MKTKLLAAVAGILASTTANATVIDFEGYTDPTVLTSVTDSGATFTGIGSTTDFSISTFGQATWGTGAPMILCPRTGGGDCPGDFEVTFASTVTDLSFLFTGDEGTSPLSVEAFLGALSLGTLMVAPDGSSFTSHLVDLSSFGMIDRIEVTGASGDSAGFGYDDFTFTMGAVVPEPATWAMMLLGFGAVGMALRRGRRGKNGIAQLA